MKARAALGVAAALLVGLPALAVGFVGEDLHALAVLEGHVEGADWTEVFRPSDAVGRFGAVQGDTFPWWTREVPEPRALRPLAAAWLALDHAVFGLEPLPHHFASIGLLAIVVLLAWRLFREIGPRPVATLATLLFLLDEAHSIAVAQVASRHALLGAALALGALLLHRRGRSAWALPTFALALAASETAAPFAVWFVADALVHRRRAGLPIAALGIVWSVAEGLAGFGPFALGVEPVRALGVRLPVLAGALLGPVRPERLAEAAGGEMLAMGCALLAVAFAALLRPVLARDRAARVLGLALLLHLPWLAFGPPSSVGLLLPSVASAYLIAAALVIYAPRAPTLAFVLGALHLLLAPALHLRNVSRLAARAAHEARVAAAVPRDPDARVLLLTSPDGVDADLPLRVRLGPSAPAGVWSMSLSLESHGLWNLEGGAEDEIGFSGDLLARARERRWLGGRPLHEGEVLRRGALEVTVREVEGDRVHRVDVRLDVPPERVWLLERQGDGYRAVELPEEGGAVTLPEAP